MVSKGIKYRHQNGHSLEILKKKSFVDYHLLNSQRLIEKKRKARRGFKFNIETAIWWIINSDFITVLHKLMVFI